MWQLWWGRIKQAQSKLTHFIRQVPLIGALITCRAKDHYQASSEFMCTILLGTMPLWLDVIRSHIFNVSRDKSWGFIWKNIIVNGELYLYCASFLAPVFYIALTDKKGDKPFPSKLSFLVSTTLILMVSAFLFSIKRSQTIYNEEMFTYISVMLFIFSAFLFYLATVYKNFKSFDFSDAMYRDEDNFIDELQQSRGQR